MPDHPFINYLRQLDDREDRAALAHLRRGLGKPPGTVVETFPYVARWVEHNPALEDAYYLIASLFAAHPEHSGGIGSLGETMRRVGLASVDMKSTERRFTALLNAHRDELPHHLRHAVSLARSKGVPVNYEQLLKDIRFWDGEQRRVQRSWARQFWAREHAEESASAATNVEGE